MHLPAPGRLPLPALGHLPCPALRALPFLALGRLPLPALGPLPLQSSPVQGSCPSSSRAIDLSSPGAFPAKALPMTEAWSIATLAIQPGRLGKHLLHNLSSYGHFLPTCYCLTLSPSLLGTLTLRLGDPPPPSSPCLFPPPPSPWPRLKHLRHPVQAVCLCLF